MNKLYEKIKQDLLRDKSIYYALLITLIISIIFGSLFITIIKESDKTLVLSHIEDFFASVKDNNTDTLNVLKNSIYSSSIYILIIWLLGISIIGIPIIIFMLFFKGFSLGFTITSIIFKYRLAGVFGALTYTFPHLVINMIVYFVIAHYSLRLSISILKNLLKRAPIDIKYYLNKYLLILGLSLVSILITSLFEVFVSPYLIRLFLGIIK